MKLITQPTVNAIELPRLLLKELGIKVSNKSLSEKLQDHPIVAYLRMDNNVAVLMVRRVFRGRNA